MKPRFALNLSTEAASLLRRVPDGWQEVGSVRFDAPNLTEAMAELRAAAGDLSGGEVATKVVIPNSQILYTSVHAPGPDRTSRRTQIRAGLEGLTPYDVPDLVYDFDPQDDESVRLAIVARETLDEAESFADEHGFNPLCFVAIPEPGQFPREPWFGIISAAQRRLPKDVKVERDDEPIRLVATAAAALPAEAAPDEDEALEWEAAPPSSQPISQHDVSDAAIAASRFDPLLTHPASLSGGPEWDEPLDAPPQSDLASAHREDEDIRSEPSEDDDRDARDGGEPFDAAPEAEDIPEPPAFEPDLHDSDLPVGVLRIDVAEPTAAFEPDRHSDLPDQSWTVAETDAPAEWAQDDVRWAAPTPEARDLPEMAPEEAFASHAGDPAVDGLTPDDPALWLPDPDPVEPATAVAEFPPPDEEPAAPPAAEPEELFVPPPLVRAPERPVPNARDLPPFTPPAPPAAAVTNPAIPEAPYVDLEEDDVPAMPPGAFASRRLAAEGTKVRPPARLVADPKPGRSPGRVPEPPVRGPAGRSALPRQPAPASAEPRAAAAVTSPGVAGSGSRKGPVAARATQPKAAKQAERVEPGAPFGGLGSRTAPRGKPRFLGLILTLVLLLVLAAVAAWSSYYLVSNEPEPEVAMSVAQAPSSTDAGDPGSADGQPAEVQVAAQPPAPDAPPATEPAAATPPAAEPAAAAPSAGNEAATIEPAANAPAVASGEATRAAPTEGPQDEIFLTAMDAAPPSLDAVAVAPPPIAPDAAPGLPLPPPPFGVKYEFDAQGMIRPSAEGVLAPGDFLLIAGKPSIIPPRRPATATESAPAAAAAAAPSGRPAPAPGSIFPGSTAAAAAGDPAPVADPALAGHRPKARPAVPATEQEAGAPAPEAATERVSSLRPRARPSDRDTPAAAEDPQAATLMMATGPAPRPDGAPDAVATSNGAISPLAIPVSRKPEARPSDFSQAIEAAVAAVVQTPKTPAVVAAIAPAPKAPTATARIQPEEEDEPEVTVAPRIPTKANVAQKATYTNAINLSKTNLIGVYGTPSSRYALVRQSNGRYVKVRVGDRIDGGVVAAISTNELRYRKGSRILSLTMPKG